MKLVEKHRLIGSHYGIIRLKGENQFLFESMDEESTWGKFIRDTKRVFYANFVIEASYYKQLRKLLRSEGIAVWSVQNNCFVLESFMTKPEKSVSSAKLLYSELESIADLNGFKEIYTNTSIPRKIMERLGWKYVGNILEKIQDY